jgi:hypothetical protein
MAIRVGAYAVATYRGVGPRGQLSDIRMRTPARNEGRSYEVLACLFGGTS